ncbi:MAG: polynucleotide adenylyltransferase, partial [Eubacteriales bacterium]|nr:polynucleotide adenylyltransferase [Eubacteriales bacterium]
MEVIVSHGGTDFDALAAMVACAKLHPQAVMVLAGSQRPGVRQFIAGNRDFLPLHRAEQLNLDKISTLYIVDAQDRRLLGELAWLCDKADTVVSYDHHPPYDQAGPGIRQQVGAVTTILVEQLRGKKLPVSPFEATLFLLGIYEDTHCLTSVTTTPRDMLAAAWLLEQGGRLSQVSKYIDIRLAPQQRDLLAALLGEARIEAVNERSVLIMAASLEQFVSGLGVLTLH